MKKVKVINCTPHDVVIISESGNITFEILGYDIYDREDKYEAYSEKEDEILGLADELLERIETDIMPKYNCYQSHDFYWRFYYKIDKKFDTLEECLDFFDISI